MQFVCWRFCSKQFAFLFLIYKPYVIAYRNSYCICYITLIICLILFKETCVEPPASNGRLATISRAIARPGDTMKVIYDTGYTPSHDTVTCTDSRTWDPTPTCSKVTCPIPDIANGCVTRFGYCTRFYFEFNHIAYVKCHEGFETFGPNSLVCLANGKWNTNSPNCIKRECNDTSKVKHPAVSAYPTLHFGESGNVTYNENDFTLSSGSLEVICSANGSLIWSEQPAFGSLFSYYLSLRI